MLGWDGANEYGVADVTEKSTTTSAKSAASINGISLSALFMGVLALGMATL